MKDLLKRSKLFLNRNGSTILTCIGGAGVVATTIMAVKATPKALKLIESAEKKKGTKLSKWETVKTAGSAYIPTAIMGVSTLACIFGANALSRRQQAALMSAYALLNHSYKEYKEKVGELYGENANAKIREELARDKYETFEVEEGKRLFYDCYAERYFESTMETVLRAEYDLNKKISLRGSANLNDFYKYLEIPQLDCGNYIGWSSTSLMAAKEVQWVDFENEMVTMDDGLECCIVTISDEPIFDYECY